MRIDATGSICSPKGCPATFELDPTAAEIKLRGTPAIEASPIAVDLPEIEFENLKVTLNPPNADLEITSQGGVFLAGLLGLGEGLEALGDALSGSSEEDASDDLEPVAKLKLTTGTLEIDGRVRLGSFKLRGIPLGDDVAPIRVGVNTDDAAIQAAFKGLTARLLGCLVVNGGDCGCCEDEHEHEAERPPKPPYDRPVISPVILPTRAKSGAPFEIEGQHLGADPGAVIVEDGEGQRRTMDVEGWSTTRIHVRQSEQLPPGNYTMQVQTADELFSNSAQLAVV